MITDIKAKASQKTPTSVSEGDMGYVQMSKMGNLFTAGWRERLIMAGMCWKASVGTFSTGADIAPITGGGNGTTIDLDQPELQIGVDAGYYLICLEAMCAIQFDLDADTEEASIILIADRTAAPDTTAASATANTPDNLLDGAGAFPGRAWDSVSGDITDPVDDEILDFVTIQESLSAAGQTASSLKMDYRPLAPSILAGPCAVDLLFGGTAAVTGFGTITVACVPTAWFPVS